MSDGTLGVDVGNRKPKVLLLRDADVVGDHRAVGFHSVESGLKSSASNQVEDEAGVDGSSIQNAPIRDLWRKHHLWLANTQASRAPDCALRNERDITRTCELLLNAISKLRANVIHSACVDPSVANIAAAYKRNPFRSKFLIANSIAIRNREDSLVYKVSEPNFAPLTRHAQVP